MTESELTYRYLGIVLEPIASSGGRNDRAKIKIRGAIPFLSKKSSDMLR